MRELIEFGLRVEGNQKKGFNLPKAKSLSAYSSTSLLRPEKT